MFRPVTVTILPLVVLIAINLDEVDQETASLTARVGCTVVVSIAPGPPVRIDALPGASTLANGSPAGDAPAGRAAGTLGAAAFRPMRKTSLPSFAYFSRTPAGSQSSALPVGAARSMFHGLNARTSSTVISRDSVNVCGPRMLS